MFRRLFPLAVFAAVVLGCSKKKDDDSGGGGDGGDPNATYTIKLRGEQKGDKLQVVKTRSGTQTTTVAGKSLPQQKEQMKFEFVETILEMPDGAPEPTKVVREYKTAQKSDAKGELKSLSYSGKTVTIEKKGKAYSYTVDGKPIPAAERAEFAEEFEKSDKVKPEDMMPTNPVKVGEAWEVDFAKVKALTGELPFALDKDKSKFTGKLARAYKKDGQQWGVIEFRIVMTVTPGKKGPPLSGTITADITLDTAIDGSVHAGSMKMTQKGTLSAKDPKAGEVKVEIDGTREDIGTPVK
jgi:hypothetical protein